MPLLDGKPATLVHLLLPQGLVERLDAYRRAHDHATRSEAIRDLIRRAADADDAEPGAIRLPRRARAGS
jgi:metal-responsive CopG/Arc/MetJ family transcriptional regulator